MRTGWLIFNPSLNVTPLVLALCSTLVTVWTVDDCRQACLCAYLSLVFGPNECCKAYN